MSIDPRWAAAEAFLDEFAPGKPFEAARFAEGFQKYASALESLAADETIPESECRQAQSILDDMARLAAPHRDMALRTLHRFAKESGDKTIRREAEEALKAATEKITPPTKARH